MKKVLWLLIAVNVVFFIVMKSGVMDDRLIEMTPLHEERIAIAAPDASSSVPEVVPPAAEKCFEWGDFSGADLERVSKSLQKLSLGGKLHRREVEHIIGYWVYIAPLKDKAATAQKLAQLKARGVTDYFVVQDAGEWLNAISLGVFKSQESAQGFLQGLRSKGVNSAKMGERAGKTRTTILEINGLGDQASAELTALQKDFPSIELKTVACH